ncbi:MAG: hypothetical protein IKV56_02175, partial [Kiritimatiellae bacterium]|nr:hypothetical protein [Kiritimatiellia bacterium]
MAPERVDEMLKSYRYEVGRCGHLKAEMEMLSRDIERDKASLAHDLVGPGAQVITDMPRGTTVGNPTEKFGTMLADGWVPEDLRAKMTKLAALEA